MNGAITLRNKCVVSYAETDKHLIIRIQKKPDGSYTSYSGPVDAGTIKEGTLEEALSNVPKKKAVKLKALLSATELTNERIAALGFGTCSVMS